MAGGARGKNGAGVPGRANGEGDGAARVPAISAQAFTGRQEELASLSRAMAGPPALVLVEGEAGIGKSRFSPGVPASGPGGLGQRSLVAGCPPFRRPCTLSRSWTRSGTRPPGRRSPG